ncbi:MAG: ACP S-malonyltransferase [Ruminococcus sp.]|nr:ACP S-malonyltransferase [Ruminococcus sp.]
MAKNVLLFSGQGSQYVGMAKELCEKYEGAKQIFATANEILGYDLAEITFNGPEEELNKTINSQPAIMACSLCALEAVKAEGIEFDGVAGHSLGEYAAMVASGVLSLEDGFRVIKARAEAMQKASESNKGAMCAVIGLPAEEIEQTCAEVDGYVIPVNYNSTVQTVIAGEVEAVDKAIELFAEKKARCMKLNVASAFHSKLMQSAADEFYEKIKDVQFNEPSVEFYSNVLGGKLEDFSDMPTLLAKHIVSPVKFTSELAQMNDSGYENFIELGPNKVLTGLVKKTLKDKTALNIENLKTLTKATETLKV